MLTRGSGMLLHISSLPSNGGIGDFGPAAYDFADFLHNAGQTYWQLLPLNPTEEIYGNCPYSSPSAFALNTLFISVELLCKEGLIKKDELMALPQPEKLDRVDYPLVTERKNRLLDQAFQRFKNTELEKGEFEKFCRKHDYWLSPYAEFLLLKKRASGKIWSDWPEDVKRREETILKELRAKFPEELKRVKFMQFIAFRQWETLREYCRRLNISLIGDIPIYVNEDSVDVWANPQIFKLNADLKPVVVAGVPPDYFSKTGQRWGNPVYDWEKLKSSGYDWWLKRIAHNLEIFDVVRIDHFRGLIGYWEVPAQEQTAIHGRWEKGPGEHFLSAIKNHFPSLPIIAEDLGVITADVTEAMNKFNLPGMKILQFAFNGDPNHPYLPENFPAISIVYTGTHDNNTTRGWFLDDASVQERTFLAHYLKIPITQDNVVPELIKLAMHSRAVIAIFPLQDILDLGPLARMNIPGTVHRNWEWRMTAKDVSETLAKSIALQVLAAKR